MNREEMKDDLLLEAYLDGALEGDARVNFEKRVAEEKRLAADVRLSGEIDGWLRGALLPPNAMGPGTREVLGRIGSVPVRAGARGGRVWMTWGVVAAAAVVMVAVGVQSGLLSGLVSGGSGQDGPRVVRGDAAACVRALEVAGFAPKWVCKDAAEFAKYTRESLGQEWRVESAPALTLVGWTYTDRLLNSNYAHVLLAEYAGRRVVVVADRVEFDRSIVAPADGSLRVHRRVMGEIVVYELSPFDEAKVLGRIERVGG